MAEPTSRLAFEDLMLRVAVEAGIAYYGSAGNERARIPINDAHDLDLCQRIVNDGIRMFIADAPPKGWRWMRRIMSVTLTATRITGTVDSLSNTTLVDATLSTTSGTADGASATTLVDATLSATYDTDDELNGYYCYIITGTGAGSYALITDYAASTGTITVADWLTAGGLPGGTDPIATDTFGISAKKILVGYYCYVTAGTGKGSWAVITGFTSSNGTVTVADWLDEYGSAGGTNPGVGSTFAITPVETVAGDITRYPLAEDFGGEVNGTIEYEPDSSHATHIEWCDESTIRARQAVSVGTGYPKLAAYRPLEHASGGSTSCKRRFELILDKEPSAAEVLTFPYTLYFDTLELHGGIATGGGATTVVDGAHIKIHPTDTDVGQLCKIIGGDGEGSQGIITGYNNTTGTITVDDWLYADGSENSNNPASGSMYIIQPICTCHPAGFRFDQAILAACMAQAEIDIGDIQTGFVEKYMKKALPAAYRTDVRSAPRKLGSMDKIRYSDRRGARMNVTTDNDL